MLSGAAITLSTVYLSLKLTDLIPLEKDQMAFFIVSFLAGGIFWVLYARRFNRTCPLDLD